MRASTPFLIIFITLLLASGIFGTACGVSGPPQPPLAETPQDSDPIDRPSPSPSAKE